MNYYYLDFKMALHECEVYLKDRRDVVSGGHGSLQIMRKFYYDGESVDDLPECMVNVPAENYKNYFLSCDDAVPDSVKYGENIFSAEVAESVVESFIKLNDYINTKRKILKTICSSTIADESLDKDLNFLFDYEEENLLLYYGIPMLYLEAMARVLVFFMDDYSVLRDETRLRCDKKLKQLKTCFSYDVVSDYNYSLYWFFLKSIHESKITNDLLRNYSGLLQYTWPLNRYSQSVVLFEKSQRYSHILRLLKNILSDSQKIEFLACLFDGVFSEDFWNLSIDLKKKDFLAFNDWCLMLIGKSKKLVHIHELYVKLFDEALIRHESELIFTMYDCLLYSWNAVLNTIKDFEVFNERVERKLARYIKNFILGKYSLEINEKNINKKGKIKVGFLQEEIFSYSIHNIFIAILGLLSDKKIGKNFEFIVYDLDLYGRSSSCKNLVKEIEHYGFQYINFHESYISRSGDYLFYDRIEKCLDIREKIISDDIDILIGIQSSVEHNFIFSSRSAPVQVLWSHGNYAYDIDDVDYRIKHGGFMSKSAVYNHHLFYEFPDYIPKSRLAPYRNPADIKKLRGSYPDNVIILGTIGRLSKLESNVYLDLVFEAMHEYENTIYLACGSGNADYVKEKVREAGLQNRWFFPGHVDPHVYGEIIDIWPNTFPHNQGLSALEVVTKGKMVIPMITSHFSEKDSVETRLEVMFQDADCDFDKLLTMNGVDDACMDFLEKNGIHLDCIGDTWIKVSTLHAPTTKKASYLSKLKFCIESYSDIRNVIHLLMVDIAKSRWMNGKATLDRFIEILDMMVEEKGV